MQLMTPKKEEVYNLLFVGKFQEALDLANESPYPLTKEEHELTSALARQFGDVGLFTGDMRVIITHALSNIGVFDSENVKPILSLVPNIEEKDG